MSNLAVLQNPDGSFTELTPGQTIVDATGTQHPWNITDLWAPSDLLTINVYLCPDPSDPTDGSSLTGHTFQMSEGILTATNVTVPPSVAQLQAYANGLQVQRAQQPVSLNVSPVGQTAVLITLIPSMLSYLSGQVAAANEISSYETVWVNPDNSVVEVSGANILALNAAYSTSIARSYQLLAEALSGISQGTVTNFTQIAALP